MSINGIAGTVLRPDVMDVFFCCSFGWVFSSSMSKMRRSLEAGIEQTHKMEQLRGRYKNELHLRNPPHKSDTHTPDDWSRVNST